MLSNSIYIFIYFDLLSNIILYLFLFILSNIHIFWPYWLRLLRTCFKDFFLFCNGIRVFFGSILFINFENDNLVLHYLLNIVWCNIFHELFRRWKKTFVFLGNFIIQNWRSPFLIVKILDLLIFTSIKRFLQYICYFRMLW